jgi:hypothetical protein
MSPVRRRMEAAARQIQQEFNPVPFMLRISMLDLPMDNAGTDGVRILSAALQAMGIDEDADLPAQDACSLKV